MPPANHIDIFVARTDDWIAHAHIFAELLSDEEQRRAETFRRITDRTEYAIAHGILRFVISRDLNQPARAIQLARRTHGKPFVANMPRDRLIEFSLSHTPGLAAVAITRDVAIGIDVERIPSGLDLIALRAIASEHLSNATRQSLNQLDGKELEREFLRAWTQHEALVKATGAGLGAPTQHADARDAPTTEMIDLGTEFVGAIAACRSPISTRMWIVAPSATGEPMASIRVL